MGTTKDTRLGQRPANATHWRCKRLAENQRKGTTLAWEDDGVELEEWPIRQLSIDTVRERWGPGRYNVVYIHRDGATRRPCGTTGSFAVPAPRPTEPAAPQPELGAVPAAVAPPTMVMPALFGNLAPGGGSDPFSGLFSLLAYINQQGVEARTLASAEARAAVERASAESRAAQERYKADLEFQLERERLASKERIAAIEATARAQSEMARAKRTGGIDEDALVQRLGALVDEKLDEREDDEEEDARGAALATPGKPAPTPMEMLGQLMEQLPDLVKLGKQFLDDKAGTATVLGGAHDAAA